MQLNPRHNHVSQKPTRRERRLIRQTPTYLDIESQLGTNDAQTLLLIQIGDLHLAHEGQEVTQRPWSQSHVLVGLSARLSVDGAGEISAPWLVDDPDLDAEVKVASPGAVMFIHRRHLHLVRGGLTGAVEPIGRLIRATLHEPAAKPVGTTPVERVPANDVSADHPASLVIPADR